MIPYNEFLKIRLQGHSTVSIRTGVACACICGLDYLTSDNAHRMTERNGQEMAYAWCECGSTTYLPLPLPVTQEDIEADRRMLAEQNAQ